MKLTLLSTTPEDYTRWWLEPQSDEETGEGPVYEADWVGVGCI